MAYDFLDLLSTPAVQAAQEANGSADYWAGFRGDRSFNLFTEAEKDFIARRDSFYMASTSESGWPYVQHRGGPVGFLRVLDETTLGFADFSGNRQYISTGNVAADDRVSLFLMDYPGKRRLKVLAHAEVKDLQADPALAERLVVPGYRARIERGVLLHLETFDWNCPQHITPRFTQAELVDVLAPVREKIAALEAENESLRRAQRTGARGAK